MSEGTKTLHPEPTKVPDSPQPKTTAGSAKPKHYRWGFLSASLVILGLMVLGEAIGRQSERAELMLADTDAMGWRGWSSLIVGVLFLLCSVGLAMIQWRAVRHFFLSIKVGTSMIIIATLSVMAGVLVPQIDGFEDPEMRVTESNYEEQFKAFAFAEAYFIYHLTHLYGLGGPIEEAKQPPGGWEALEERLELFGRKYGREEQKNREKEMRAAFANRAKMPYISGGDVLQEVETANGTELKEVYVKGFVKEHDAFLRGFFDFSTALNLNRAYKSYWFKTLMSLLAVAVAMNFLRMPLRKMFTIEKAGFAVVHLGVFVMLLGGAISNHNTDRGILHLDLREAPKNTYWRHYDRSKLSKMPFWVGLDLFDRQDWRQIQVMYRGENFASRPPEYTLWPGRKIELDFQENAEGELKPRIVLEVLGLYDHARQGAMEIREARPGESGEGPVAELLVPDTQAMQDALAAGQSVEDVARLVRTAYLAPEHRDAALLYGPDWSYRLKGLFADEEPSLGELFPAENRVGTLTVQMRTSGDVEDHRIPIRLGQTVDAPGGFQIKAVEATANYQQDQRTGGEIRDARPLAQQPPYAPGLWIEITPPGGGEHERRLVLEHVDAVTHGKQQDYDYPELIVDFDWEYWQSAGPPRYVLLWGPNSEPVLIDEAGDRNAVISGRRLPMSEDVMPITARSVFKNSKFEGKVEFLESRVGEDGFDASFYSNDAPGLELKVTIDNGEAGVIEEVRRLAATPGGLVNVYRSPDETFDVLFYENDRTMPFEWRSVLSIYEEDPSGAWTVFSGKTGRAIGALSADQAKSFESKFGRDAVSLNVDRDGDGEKDWTGPMRMIDRGSERDREIRVNDYFTHDGFRFFQTNAIPEIPTYSGIGVVYDPGIEPVLLGMYTIILGTVLAYLVRPIVQSRRERRKAA